LIRDINKLLLAKDSEVKNKKTKEKICTQTSQNGVTKKCSI